MLPIVQATSTEFSSSVVNYTDGDFSLYDQVKDLSQFFPLRPMTNLIGFCKAGSLSMQIGDREVVVNANDVLFCTPNDRIDHLQASPDFDCKLLYISDHILQGLLHDKISIWHRAIFIDHKNIISMSSVCREEFNLYHALILSKMRNAKDKSSDIIKTIIRALLLELCNFLEKYEVVKEESGNLTQGRILFNKFLNMVSSNEVKRQPISKYASELAITPKYLTMLCLKYSNKTASDWIIEYTLEDIRFYLRRSNLSIKEISAKLGFANMSHFGSYTRKHLGMSPRDFRYKK